MEGMESFKNGTKEFESIYTGTHKATDISPFIHQAAIGPHLSIDDLHMLCDASLHFNFSGFCTDLTRLAEARKRLGTSKSTKLIAIIAFPFGFIPSNLKENEAEWAASQGADELDLIPNLLALRENKIDLYGEEIASICERGLPVRVVLNYNEIRKESISIATNIALEAGAVGVQNSNGFGPKATANDIIRISKIVRGRCEIKAVGGIKTLDHVIDLIDAGATHIGTSFGPQIIQSLRLKEH